MSVNSKAAPVRFKNVTKIYGKDVLAVDDINLKIEAGKLVTLLGPSGCGKTTTLRMIAGLEMATSGSIYIGDQDELCFQQLIGMFLWYSNHMRYSLI